MIAKLGVAAAALATTVGIAVPASAHERVGYDRGPYIQHYSRARWEQMRRHRFFEEARRPYVSPNYAPRYYNY